MNTLKEDSAIRSGATNLPGPLSSLRRTINRVDPLVVNEDARITIRHALRERSTGLNVLSQNFRNANLIAMTFSWRSTEDPNNDQ